MKRTSWSLFTLGLFLLGTSSVAEAQQRGRLPDKSIGVGLAVQAGGRLDYDGRRDFNGYDHLDGTVGLHVHWDNFLMQRQKGKVSLGVSLGLLARVLTWQQEDVRARNLLLDLALRARFVVGFREFGFYAGPAVGPTLLSLLNDDYGSNDRARPGLNVSFVAAGFEWWWNADHALFVELGWAGHWLYHGPFDPRMGQALIAMGVDFGR